MTDETQEAIELPPKPEDRITIRFKKDDGEVVERVLFMSWMRQNSISRFLTTPQDVIYLLADPDNGENVLRIMLAEKGGAGEMLKGELPEDAISAEDYERVLVWVQDHMTHFFMKRFQDLALKAKALGPMAKALMSSAPGSPGSDGQTASAGPST